MNKSRLCIGIDVGKEELVVALEAGMPRTFGTTPAEVKRLARWINGQCRRHPVHIGMEATGVYSHRIAAILSGCRHFTVSVINPAQIKAFGKAMLKRTKTDRVDARVIQAFVRSQSPPVWTPPEPERQQLYALVAQADAIQNEILRWKNRRHAHAHDINIPEAVNNSTATLIDALQQQLEAVSSAIHQLCAAGTELAADMALLTSIKGVGIRSAAQILAYGGEALTKRTRRQLDAYAGLVAAQRQSGTSVHGKSHLAKQGNVRLRRALYMPTLVAVQFNPILKKFYQQLLKRGKPKKLALTACMRKMLNIIRAMLIKRNRFDPQFQLLT